MIIFRFIKIWGKETGQFLDHTETVLHFYVIHC